MARGGKHMVHSHLGGGLWLEVVSTLVHSHPGGGMWLEVVSTLVHSHPEGGMWLEVVSTWCILIQEVVCG